MQFSFDTTENESKKKNQIKTYNFDKGQTQFSCEFDY